MLSINTNTTAIIAQNNLGNIQQAMQSSMQKLSSGKRINSSADDAAGLQVSSRMTTQIQGLDVAMRNANDAISMSQTAEGAMQEHTNIMNRMRDLALQSANDTNSLAERKAMQEEIVQLQTELNRIAETTDFSGKKLLDGSSQDMTFQIGANANETIAFSIAKMDTKSLKGTGETAVATADVDTALNSINSNTSITITIDDQNITINGRDPNDRKIDARGLAKEINEKIKEAQKKEVETDRLKKDITAGSLNDGSLIFYGDDEVKIKFGATAEQTTAKGNLSDIDVTSSGSAQKAIKAIDNALGQVNSERATLGAIQNRLDATLNNLSNVQENMIASRSRIEDVDFAKEATSMTRTQMLMQAGSSVLMQAKGLPEFALQMIG